MDTSAEGRSTDRGDSRDPGAAHTRRSGRGHRLCAARARLFAYRMVVDDPDDLLLLIAGNPDGFEGFSRSAVRADRAAVQAGVGGMLRVGLAALGAGALRSGFSFHAHTPFALRS